MNINKNPKLELLSEYEWHGRRGERLLHCQS